jgi:hypothetical protein
MVKLENMREGSIVIVRGGFGTDSPIKAIVEEVEEDVKNGRPGICYKAIGAKEGNWAYLTQVDRVVQY